MRVINREIISALLFSKDGKIFQGRKDPNRSEVYAEFWHIPGGGIEAGETLEEGLIREIREETGIDITPYKIELVDDLGGGEHEIVLKDTGERVLSKMKFNVFKVVIDDKNADEIKVSLDDDLVSYRWFDLAELEGLDVTPPSVKLFKRLGYLK